MKGIWILFGILSGIIADLEGQRIPLAKNVDVSIGQNQAIIHFDIISKNTAAVHVVDLKFLDEDYNLVIPDLLTGDIGSGIPGGSNRTIIWDVTNDLQLFGSRVTPILFINGKSKQFSKTGGIRNAWLSILMPGLGDYFVADHRMMVFKPYLRTISSIGLLGMGIYAGSQRTFELTYEKYVKADAWRYAGEDMYYFKEVKGAPDYCFFKWDKEILITAGAALWAADILWVLARGSNNTKFLKATSRDSVFNLGYIPGGLAFQYAFTF
ncbi:MAG: hypothetical protein V2B15_13755 [Bacteroidota bacterium]